MDVGCNMIRMFLTNHFGYYMQHSTWISYMYRLILYQILYFMFIKVLLGSLMALLPGWFVCKFWSSFGVAKSPACWGVGMGFLMVFGGHVSCSNPIIYSCEIQE